MTEQQFNQQLDQILGKIENLPDAQRKAIMAMAEDTRKQDQAIRAEMARTRDALDDWRLLQKYRIFDAEARLREEQAGRPNPEDRC